MRFAKFLSFIFITCSILFGCSTLSVNAQVVMTADSIEFDSQFYAMTNPEIVAEYGDTFDGLYRHYLEHGKEEGRLPNASAGVSTKALSTVVINENSSDIIVGDSRVYLMHSYVGNDNTSWMGYPGSRCDVLSGVIAQNIDALPIEGKRIVIMYGLNDITGLGLNQAFSSYNAFLNGKAQEWINKGAKVYFVNMAGIDKNYSVAGVPVSQDRLKQINKDVSSFNNMMAYFPSNIKRIYVSYGSNPFSDGIHFNESTCKSVYKQIKSQLK